MDAMDIVGALEKLPGIRADVTAGIVSAQVSAVNDTVRIDAAGVKRHRRIWAPNGDPAVEFAMDGDRGPWPLIVTPADVVFPPAATSTVLDSAIEYRITDVPPLVAYSEMERAAEQVAVICARPGSMELAGLSAKFLLTRCFIAAAIGVGLRPTRSVAWWQQAWDAVGGEVLLPPFRADPTWDELAREVSRPAAIAPAVRTGGGETDSMVTVADFHRLEPALNAVRLDDEFVRCWRRFIPGTPERFVEVLLDHLAGARADIALYPNGSGSVDVTVRGADTAALLQLSWSDRKTMRIDEVRIPDALAHSGLFQRMMFNTERLAHMLGFGELTLLASGVGAYAFARLGNYPRDPWSQQAR